MKRSRSLLRRIDGRVLRRAAEIIKVLGHSERLKIVDALENGELTVSEIYDLCGLGQAVCSQHLRRLRALGVVEARKQGLNVIYRVVDPKVRHILACIRTCHCGT